jgi:hypothetical protein
MHLGRLAARSLLFVIASGACDDRSKDATTVTRQAEGNAAIDVVNAFFSDAREGRTRSQAQGLRVAHDESATRPHVGRGERSPGHAGVRFFAVTGSTGKVSFAPRTTSSA